MFKTRSKAFFVGLVIQTLYMMYIVSYFLGVNVNSTDATEAIGSGIATALVAPHMFVLIIATILGWIGFFIKNRGFMLTNAILCCVSGFLFFLYAIFLIPSIVLNFVGFAKQKNINKKTKNSEAVIGKQM